MLVHTFQRFEHNDLFTSAAAMSYFAILALFPALLTLLALSNKTVLGSEMLSLIVQAYPGSKEFLRATVRSLSDIGTAGVITCVIVVLWAGSWVFAVAERALNRIWETKPRRFLRGRALTVAMVGAVGLLLGASVLLTSILVTLQHLVGRIPFRVIQRFNWLTIAGSAVWQLAFLVSSLLLTFALFAMIYRFMPNARVNLRDAIPGAMLAGILWEAAKYIFAWSLQFFHYDQIYGSVGAVIAVLTWGYVSSLILLLGAQLTEVFHREHPSANAAAADASPGTATLNAHS
jgi:membrane protein